MINFNSRVFEGKTDGFEVIPVQEEKIKPGGNKKGGNYEKIRTVGRVLKESGNNLRNRLNRFFGTKFGNYVAVKGEKNDEILLMNVSSLSKEVLSDKKTVKENDDSNQLESKIEGKIKELTIKDENLTPELLIKVIEATLESEKGVIRFNVGDKEGGNVKQKYFAYVDSDQNIIIKKQSKLGEGTLGKAKLWRNIADGTEEVFKQAKRKFEGPLGMVQKMKTRANEDLEMETEVLSYIHNEGKCIGIEDTPSQVVEIQAPLYEVVKSGEDLELKRAKKTKVQRGIIKTKFDGDYEGVLETKLPFKTALLHSLQLLAGGKFLADKDVLQGDIKPANIFVKGRYVKIADFGGACKASEEADLSRIFRNGGSRGFTFQYLNVKDLAAGSRLVDKNNKEELIRLEKKGDAFALGIILYQAFTGTYPFSKMNDFIHAPIVGSYIGFDDDSDVPKEVQDIINGLLMDKYKERFSCEQAFFPLLKYVEEKHPDIAAEFKEMMQGFREIKPSQEDVPAEHKHTHVRAKHKKKVKPNID